MYKFSSKKNTVKHKKKVPPTKKWFVLPKYKKSVPSPAEKRIRDMLRKMNVKFHREVSFADFKTPNGGYYRYDFYLPGANLILEYDGWRHDCDGMKDIDELKNKYAKKRRITLIRFNKQHWENLEDHVTIAVLTHC